MNKQESEFLSHAQTAGIIPHAADHQHSVAPAATWMVVLMGFIGALFATLPFLALFLLAIGQMLHKNSIAGLVIGVLFLCSAYFIWRHAWENALPRPSPYGFLVQFGLMIVMAGVGIMLSSGVNILTTALLVFVVGMLINIHWIAQLLGFAAGLAFANVYSLSPHDYQYLEHAGTGVTILLGYFAAFPAGFLTLVWVFWVMFESRVSARFGVSVWPERISRVADAIAAAVLATVAYHSSTLVQMAFHNRSSAQGSADSAEWGTASLWHWNVVPAVQAAIIIMLGIFLAWRWGLLSRDRAKTSEVSPSCNLALALLSIAYLTWALLTYVSYGNAVVCALATLALATLRKRLFVLALLVLLAQLSGFYYALQWTLVQKAGLLVAVGAGVAAAVAAAYMLWGRVKPTDDLPAVGSVGATVAKGMGTSYVAWAIALGGVLALGAVNYDVFKKEQVIANGQKIYIALRPADPRSIMQGDYMALNFQLSLPDRRGDGTDTEPLQGDKFVIAQLDARGVASVLSPAQAATQATSARIRLPLKYKNGRWVLVTDAFHFPEGQGEPFIEAQFGEFRSLPDGRALLIGLADAELKSIQPAPKVKSASAKE